MLIRDKCLIKLGYSRYNEELKSLLNTEIFHEIELKNPNKNKIDINEVVNTIMDKLCNIKGKCFNLSIYLCSLLMKMGLNAYVVIVKPNEIRSLEHHAIVIVVVKHGDEEYKLMVLDPMQYCSRQLPWPWKMVLNKVSDVKAFIGSPVVLFNDKETYLYVC